MLTRAQEEGHTPATKEGKKPHSSFKSDHGVKLLPFYDWKSCMNEKVQSHKDAAIYSVVPHEDSGCFNINMSQRCPLPTPKEQKRKEKGKKKIKIMLLYSENPIKGCLCFPI